MEYLPSRTIEGMQRISEAVFVVMCPIVGTSEQIVIRREALDIREVLDRRISSYDGIIDMISGSTREGFRLKDSDADIMFWFNNQRVIMDMSQSKYYNTANTTLILSASSESPPGFTLLQLLTATKNSYVHLACVGINDKVFISSSTWLQLTCSIAMPNSTIHGPCRNTFYGGLEHDIALCFVCDFWPPSASSWINRCHFWPDPKVVDSIVRNGCHFVAIGHPLGPRENEEWRISFSQAEYKLVYSMNHCQFLTYGLLKLFLKEVINQQSEEPDKLLCSYHMKTAVFWAIQQNTLTNWCPQDLLAGFWICFKLLLKWVYEGICPNFFIPQNNLFLTKIHGSAQNRLFLQLHELYKKGLACLLQCSSIRFGIIKVLYYPRLYILLDDRESDYDTVLIEESFVMFRPGKYQKNLCQTTKIINTIEQLVELPMSHYQSVVLQKRTVNTLQSTAFLLQNMYTYTSANKQMYVASKMACHMLKLAARLGCISDMLYIALYYYNISRYMEALPIIEMTKVKLAHSYLLYGGRVDKAKYTEAVGGQSWSTKLKQAVAEDITLANTISYMNELILEQQCTNKNRVGVLNIPVFVMLHFLEFLCYRHIDARLSQAALRELQMLVHHDQGRYVNEYFRDISWEILGISQQITGNLQAALNSYQQSLIQYPCHRIQTATQRRIQDIVKSTPH